VSTIFIRQSDITLAEVDAIVNAANSVMLGGGGVDGAIHRAAGPRLLDACRKIEPIAGIRCPTGECRITEAGDLSAKFVIHTAGPRYAIDTNPQYLLACCYTNSLRLAMTHNCTSIAFPAISCGIYGFPIAEAADIAISQSLAPEFSNLTIYFYLYGQETFESWQAAMAKAR